MRNRRVYDSPSAGEGCAIVTGGCLFVLGYYAAIAAVIVGVGYGVLKLLGAV